MHNNKTIYDALTVPTAKVFDAVSTLDCIKDLYLCGGTAQALQTHHRKSEDLDFELLGIRKDRPSLDMSGIISEICEKFPGAKRNMLGSDHLEIYIDGGVKLSFFRPQNNVPRITPGLRFNNISTVAPQDLLGMKLYTITQRAKFRDYYDIYSLLKDGYSLSEGIRYACAFSKHEIHSKDIYSTLLNDRIFVKPDGFKIMDPKYDVSSHDICKFIQRTIEEEKALGEAAFLKNPDASRELAKKDIDELTALGVSSEDIERLRINGVFVVDKNYVRPREAYDIKEPPRNKGVIRFAIKDDRVYVVLNPKRTVPLHESILISGALNGSPAREQPLGKTASNGLQPPGCKKH